MTKLSLSLELTPSNFLVPFFLVFGKGHNQVAKFLNKIS